MDIRGGILGSRDIIIIIARRGSRVIINIIKSYPRRTITHKATSGKSSVLNQPSYYRLTTTAITHASLFRVFSPLSPAHRRAPASVGSAAATTAGRRRWRDDAWGKVFQSDQVAGSPDIRRDLMIRPEGQYGLNSKQSPRPNRPPIPPPSQHAWGHEPHACGCGDASHTAKRGTSHLAAPRRVTAYPASPTDMAPPAYPPPPAYPAIPATRQSATRQSATRPMSPPPDRARITGPAVPGPARAAVGHGGRSLADARDRPQYRTLSLCDHPTGKPRTDDGRPSRMRPIERRLGEIGAPKLWGGAPGGFQGGPR